MTPKKNNCRRQVEQEYYSVLALEPEVTCEVDKIFHSSFYREGMVKLYSYLCLSAQQES